MRRYHRPFALLSTLATAALLTPHAFAEYTGPSNTPIYKTIGEVLQNPVDDVQVSLEGYLLREVGKEKHIFSDGKSEVRVDIDRKLMPATAINDKTRVLIRGEIEKDFMQSPEIDVDHLSVLN